jgi:hypothetical protein
VFSTTLPLLDPDDRSSKKVDHLVHGVWGCSINLDESNRYRDNKLRPRL